jgi:hypothetical protein
LRLRFYFKQFAQEGAVKFAAAAQRLPHKKLHLRTVAK